LEREHALLALMVNWDHKQRSSGKRKTSECSAHCCVLRLHDVTQLHSFSVLGGLRCARYRGNELSGRGVRGKVISCYASCIIIILII
jgi:hypothetical protein